MLTRIIKSILLASLAVSSAFAQYHSAGTTAFSFLNISADARSTGMGDVNVGMPNDIYGAQGNPAAIAYPARSQAMIAYRPIMLDVRAGALGFSNPVRKAGTLCGSLYYVSYGLFDGRDENNARTNVSWRPYSLAGSISWARIFYDGFGMGITLKGIYDNLDHGYSADGAAADIGAQYRMNSSRLIFGALVRNIGFVRKWYFDDDSLDVSLPFSASTGISYLPAALPSLKMALDLEKSIDDYLNYKAGLEIALYKQYLFVRTGYRFSNRDLREVFKIIRSESDDSYQKTNWNSVSIGVGLFAPISGTDVKIDFALPFHTEGLPPAPALSAIISF
jgi:hypothetical protein